jgi:DNA (cytosine-5)-methyltransferase 1
MSSHDLAIFEQKRRRLDAGQAPRVLDLFAGCGGMSLGFQRAGAEIVAGFEIDPIRARTHAHNFHRHLGAEAFERHSRAVDITALTPTKALANVAGENAAVDIIVGGPPCQAYSRVGRAKLREIAQRPDAYLHDERGQLYAAYIKYVDALQPLAVVMENVPDILAYGGDNVAELAAEGLEDLGYECRYTLMNAAHYGVPQTRERWYLIGIHRSLRVTPSFPKPSHFIDLPAGYRGTRARAAAWRLAPEAHSVPLAEAERSLPIAVSCEQALSDLPPLDMEEFASQGRAKRDLRALVAYLRGVPTDYQHEMRKWNGPGLTELVSSHVIRVLPRDGGIFKRMKEGDDYPAAFAIAEKRFAAELKKRRDAGEQIPDNGVRWTALRAEMVPPYDPSKFPNKWRKLERDYPSRTLLAHLSHDTYSHIHYDSAQARTISVREAARLQSFPDRFEFCGAMNSAFGQIGNAVPPLMAFALAKHLRSMLSSQSESAEKIVSAVGGE